MLLKLCISSFIAIVLAMMMSSSVFKRWMNNTLDLPLHLEGNALPQFKSVIKTFRYLIDSGLVGGAFSVYHRGKLVVEVHGGYADVKKKEKWKRNTMTSVNSVTNAMSSLCIGMLVERGLISYEEKISHYWPEFGVNGKENITVRMLLDHRAGLAALDEPVQLNDLLNEGERFLPNLIKQTPNYTPGATQSFHTYTFAMYVDQLLKRVDPMRRNVQVFFHDEVAKPFGLNIAIGSLNTDVKRNAKPYFQPYLLNIKDRLMNIPWYKIIPAFKQTNNLSIFQKSLGSVKNLSEPVEQFFDRISSSSVPLTSAGDAISLARFAGIFAFSGKLGRHQVLQERSVIEFTRRRHVGSDGSSLAEMVFAAGLMQIRMENEISLVGHVGFGGQYVFADVERQVAFAFVTNDMKDYPFFMDPRAISLIQTVFECVDNT